MTTGEKSRALLEWAFFTCLAVITALTGIYLPLLYFPVTVVLPLPVLLLVLRLDTRSAFASLAAAGAILLLLPAGPSAVLVLIFHYGLLGVLYGLLFKNHASSGASIAAGLLGSAFLALLAAGLVYALTGENPFGLSQESRRMAEQWVALNQKAGTFSDLPAGWQEDFGEKLIGLVELFIPGQYVVTAAAGSAATFCAARAVLRRLAFSLPPGPAFSKMSFPWYSVWGLITGLALTLAGDHFSLQAAAKAGKNILFVLFYAYLALGLSVAAHFYQKVKVAAPVKIIFLFLALLYFPFSTILLLVLGVADPLINFRRLPAQKE